MAGFGAASEMHRTVQKLRRKRPSAFEKMGKLPNGAYQEGEFSKKATPQQLKAIKEKVRKEQRSLFLKRAILFIVSLGILCYFLLFHKF